MKRYTFTLLICCVLFLFSCNKKEQILIPFQTENGSDFKEIAQITETEVIKLPLGANAAFNQASIAFDSIGKDGQYLSYLNFTDNSLTFHNLLTKAKEKITFYKEGPSGVGTIGYTTAHLFENENSYFIYQPNGGVLYNLDSLASIKKKYQIIDPDKDTNDSKPIVMVHK